MSGYLPGIYDINEQKTIKTNEAMKIFGLPGTSFSPRRAIGIDVLKRKLAKATGIPTTRQGMERKIGRTLMKGVKSIIER